MGWRWHSIVAMEFNNGQEIKHEQKDTHPKNQTPL